MQGNHLRELDRLLSLLIDAAAAHRRPADDQRSIARIRDTARKLHLVEQTITCATEAGRLRAIGRIRACLHHCGGVIHAASLHRDVSAAEGMAWQEPPPGHDIEESARLLLSVRAMGAISELYRRIGDRLIDDILTSRREI